MKNCNIGRGLAVLLTSTVLLGGCGKVEETKKEETKEAVDYSKMTVAELKEAAKNAKVEGYSTMKKAELVAALEK